MSLCDLTNQADIVCEQDTYVDWTTDAQRTEMNITLNWMAIQANCGQINHHSAAHTTSHARQDAVNCTM